MVSVPTGCTVAQHADRVTSQHTGTKAAVAWAAVTALSRGTAGTVGLAPVLAATATVRQLRTARRRAHPQGPGHGTDSSAWMAATCTASTATMNTTRAAMTRRTLASGYDNSPGAGLYRAEETPLTGRRMCQ